MKQLIQSLKTGKLELIDCPAPASNIGNVIIQTTKSVISAGTEKMLLEFGKVGYLNKAKLHPDKVRHIIEKIKTDGLLQTIDTVNSKLDQPITPGYCNAGVILESGVDTFSNGDRVVSNSNHAEVVCAPKNLCAKIPDDVDDDTASFTVLGSIALQGIRLLAPTIGETIVVQGLGLIGLLAVQILKANGCRVVGIDVNSSRCQLAQEFGAEALSINNGQDPIDYARNITDDIGVDGILVCTASNNDTIMHQAAEMCRKRGRIVLIGTAGLKLRRDDFFKKELSFQVSASYGPGRYDPNYEGKGQDYPIGFVRWTEQRNFQAVLHLMSEGKIEVKPMITHRFPFADAVKAYDLLAKDKPSLGIILEYNYVKEAHHKKTIQLSSKTKKIEGIPSLGIIGAGNYAGSVLIPAFKKLDVYLKTIASSGGLSGAINGKKFGFQQTTSDSNSIFQDNEIDAIVISTRHNTHAELVIKSLESGKHVFVEKPLALTLNELEAIQSCIMQYPTSMLMVGFNRRFSPFVVKMKELLSVANNSVSMVMTVNAGDIPQEHWTHDPKVGGGRIIGEVCHFIDLQRYLAGAPIKRFKKVSMQSNSSDTLSISLEFENGSIGTIHYLANGHKSFPKESIEIFFGGKILQLDNFRKLKGFGVPGFTKMSTIRQDKGQLGCAQSFIEALLNGDSVPIPIEEILEVTRVSIELAENN